MVSLLTHIGLVRPQWVKTKYIATSWIMRSARKAQNITTLWERKYTAPKRIHRFHPGWWSTIKCITPQWNAILHRLGYITFTMILESHVFLPGNPTIFIYILSCHTTMFARPKTMFNISLYVQHNTASAFSTHFKLQPDSTKITHITRDNFWYFLARLFCFLGKHQSTTGHHII